MKKDEIKLKIETEPDFINAPFCDNSLAKLLSTAKRDITDEQIERYLMIDKLELKHILAKAFETIRKYIKG